MAIRARNDKRRKICTHNIQIPNVITGTLLPPLSRCNRNQRWYGETREHKISLFRRIFIFSFIQELNKEDTAAKIRTGSSWLLKNDFMVDTLRANERIPCFFFQFYLGINACDVVPSFAPLFDVFRAEEFTSAMNRDTRTATTVAAAVHPCQGVE